MSPACTLGSLLKSQSVRLATCGSVVPEEAVLSKNAWRSAVISSGTSPMANPYGAKLANRGCAGCSVRSKARQLDKAAMCPLRRIAARIWRLCTSRAQAVWSGPRGESSIVRDESSIGTPLRHVTSSQGAISRLRPTPELTLLCTTFNIIQQYRALGIEHAGPLTPHRTKPKTPPNTTALRTAPSWKVRRGHVGGYLAS